MISSSYDLKLGYSCNNYCFHCVVEPQMDSMRQREGRIDQTYAELVNCMNSPEFRRADGITITGGEPTIRDDFIRILKYIVTHYPKKRIMIQTNGRKLKEYVKPIYKLSRKIGYVVALHSTNEEIHNRITGNKNGNPFKETWGALEEIKRVYPNFMEAGRVEIVLSRLNLRDFYDTVVKLHENAINYVGISYPHLDGRYERNRSEAERIGFPYQELKEELPKVHQYAKEHPDLLLTFEEVPKCMWRDENGALLGPLTNISDNAPFTSEGEEVVVRFPDYQIDDFVNIFRKAHKHSSKCRDCVLSGTCLGVWYEAMDMFGDEGFVPIKETEAAQLRLPESDHPNIRSVECADGMFCDTDAVMLTPDLYFSRRDSKVLIVEPETASWCVLTQPEWVVFRRIGATSEKPNTFPAEPNVGLFGRAIRQIDFKDQLKDSDFFRLLYQLFRRNMISINGSCFYQPSSLWKVQDYPHYFNLHMTEACNLACKYCYVYSQRQAPMMTPETCRTIVKRVIEEIPSEEVNIGFHGGEPLLNIKAVEAGAAEAKAVATRLNKSVSLSLQTNGILLSSKNIATLKEHGFKVGISIDGPSHIHDQQRVYPSGEGSHSAVLKGLQAAIEAGLGPGFLAVVHQPENYEPVLNYLVREIGAHSVRINYTGEGGRAKDALDFPTERGGIFAREWLKMVDYAVSYHNETGVWLDIEDLDVFVFHLLSKQRPMMCYRSPCGIGNSILGFGYDGQIYLCDELVGKPSFRIGSIYDATPLNLLLRDSPVKRSVMETRKVENLSKCSTCPWKRFHGSGCTSKTYATFGVIDKDDPMCYLYQSVFEELMWRLWEKPELAHLVGHYGASINLAEAIQSLCVLNEGQHTNIHTNIFHTN